MSSQHSWRARLSSSSTGSEAGAEGEGGDASLLALDEGLKQHQQQPQPRPSSNSNGRGGGNGGSYSSSSSNNSNYGGKKDRGMRLNRSIVDMRMGMVDQQEKELALFLNTIIKNSRRELAGEEPAMNAADPHEAEEVFRREMEGFKDLFARYKETQRSQNRTTFLWEGVLPPPPDIIVDHSELPLPQCADRSAVVTVPKQHGSDEQQEARRQRVSDVELVDRLSMPSSSSNPNCDIMPRLPEASQLLQKLVVIKLNGGLGTTMGCTGPKSAIEVHSGLTFLDLTVHQIQHLKNAHGVSVPLLLMNSFYTDRDTQQIIQKYNDMADISTFNQSRFPRISKNSMLPMAQSLNSPDEFWYPPGHGDVFRALANTMVDEPPDWDGSSSGRKIALLDRLLADGKEFMFLSNIDNLGATVDFAMLNLMATGQTKRASDGEDVELGEHRQDADGAANGSGRSRTAQAPDFVMEITPKTKSDVKGGTFIEYHDPETGEKSARLFEIAQCPPKHVDDFKSIKKFKYFNTNNLWINLKALKQVIVSGKLREMEIIVNQKTIGHTGEEVIQLETAAGSAIRFFSNVRGVVVRRDRFLPVKSTSDLLLLQSNLYRLKHGYVMLDPTRDQAFGLGVGQASMPLPIVKLGDFFQKVGEFQSRFPSIPDILELEQLTIAGDVRFGRGVVLRGTVIIVANTGEQIDIPAGSVLDNKIISGHLRILDY